METQPFLELDLSSLQGKTVLIDMDGSLIPEGGTKLDDKTVRKIHDLMKENEVFLSSNTLQRGRFRELAEAARVPYVTPKIRKPSIRALGTLPEQNKKRDFVVIGDQWITDGLFAWNLGGTWIKVKRLRDTKEPLLSTLRFALDDLLFAVVTELKKILPYFKLLRPHQWVKNLLVFAPIIFAHSFFNEQIFYQAIVAFVTFCTASSAVYIANDILDLKQDRLHSQKRHNPLPSGGVDVSAAMGIGGIFLAVTVLLLIQNPTLVPIIGGYVLLNLLYSLSLKHIAVVDVILVASFYVLRVMAGGAATGVALSSWIILCVFFISLFIILGKRRGELAQISRRKVLASYSPQALEYMLVVSAGLSIVSYGIYTVIGAASPLAVYSSIFVICAVLRLLNNMFTKGSESEYPERFLFADPVIVISFFLWLLYMVAILYVFA